MSPQLRSERGRRLEQMMNDELMQEALGLVERAHYEEFKAATTDDDRRNAWAKAHNLAELQNKIVMIMEDGELARLEIAAEEKRTSASTSHK